MRPSFEALEGYESVSTNAVYDKLRIFLMGKGNR